MRTSLGWFGRFALVSVMLGALGACGGDDDDDSGPATGGKGGGGGTSAGGVNGGGTSAGGTSAGGSAGATTAGAAGGGQAGTISSAGGAGGQSGASAGGAGGAAGQKTCEPACVAPQTCGKSGTCLEPGTCAADVDCDTGTVCDTAKKTCVPGSSCGVTQIGAEQVPPNFLIVLDRSCSMTDKSGKKTKWDVAVAALSKLTTDYKGKIRFGLTMFPDLDADKCGQGAIPIPVAADNESKVQGLLTKALDPKDPNFPDGPCVTNIDAATAQAGTEPAFADKTRESFVLLVSDGKQSGCGGGGADAVTVKNIKALHAKGVSTFVVGFGAATDFDQMDQFAQAGGEPNPDPKRDYYLAEDEESLNQAFATIAKQTLGCTYKLQSAPPEPDSLFVFLDKDQQVLRDTTHTKGWDYDETSQTVTFYGATCASLQSGEVSSLDIVFGCPTTDTVPVPPGCASGVGCDTTHLCPADDKGQARYCSSGCCVAVPPIQ